MGTRAQFFIGNPIDVENREYLGCIAWDGYPNGDCGDALRGCTSLEAFREGIAQIAKERDDFGDAKDRAWPFPWKDDLFLTDVTFAFFDNQVMATYFHAGFRPLEFFYQEDGGEYGDDHADEIPGNIKAPLSSKPPAPDSIMVLTANPSLVLGVR